MVFSLIRFGFVLWFRALPSLEALETEKCFEKEQKEPSFPLAQQYVQYLRSWK